MTVPPVAGASDESPGALQPPSHQPSSPALVTITAGPDTGSVVVVGTVVMEAGAVVVGAEEVGWGAAVVSVAAGGSAPSGRIGVHAAGMVKIVARPTFTALFQNWTRSDLSFFEKVRQGIENNRIKMERGSQCCGNHGEVGC